MIFKITPCTCEFLDQKIEKSPTCGDFENFDPPPPSWHQILEPIKILAAIFVNTGVQENEYLGRTCAGWSFERGWDRYAFGPV